MSGSGRVRDRPPVGRPERGFFARAFCANEFAEHGLNTNWVQANNSLSRNSGTLRGIHFQKDPHSEVKLVRCIKGSVWDVVVDLRPNSGTSGQWFGTILSEHNRQSMYVPKNFGHGFISLEPDSEIFYLVSEFYAPSFECTLAWDDPDLNIEWPVNPSLISEKDNLGLPLEKILTFDEDSI